MNTEKSFGRWLKQQRKRSDLTQAELAQKIGCSTINIRKIESDERKPSRQVALLIAGIFQIPEKDRAGFLQFARSSGFFDSLPAGNDFLSPKGNGSGDGQPSPAGKPASFDRLAPIPAARTSYLGRDQEHGHLDRLIFEQGARLVTLTGPPGVGKTRLATEAGLRFEKNFPGGASFISLASVRSPEQVGWAVAHGLGISENGESQFMDHLVAFLRERSFLLILDNFEHLLGAALLVSDLLTACPRLVILATSREPLHIYGEYEVPVSPLALPDYQSLAFSLDDVPARLSQFPSIKLFVQRAQAVRPGFEIDRENAGLIADICARLDGLPLAIELTAARVKIFSIETVLAQIKNRLGFVTRSTRDAAGRHQTLNSAIEWSYQLLSRPEKDLLASLAIFHGDFPAEAVPSVCGEPGAVDEQNLDLLFSLVEKSLVQPQHIPSRRFVLLETIREYALARLEEGGKVESLQAAHARYFLHLAEEAEPYLHSPLAAQWMDQLDKNYTNIRAALAWAFTGQAVTNGMRAASSLLFYWFRRSTLTEAHLWLGKAVSCSDPVNRTTTRAKACMSFGAVGYFVGKGKIFEENLQLSVELWKEAGENRGLAMSCFWLSLLSDQGGAAYLDESIRLFRKVNDPWWLAYALWLRAALSFSSGIFPPAMDSLIESEAIFESLQDPYGLSYIYSIKGRADMYYGRYQAAVIHLHQALDLKKQIGDKWGIGQSQKDLGDVTFIQATDRTGLLHAQEWLEKAVELFRELNVRHTELFFSLHRLGNVLQALGEPKQAKLRYREALELYCQTPKDPGWLPVILVGPAHLTCAGGQYRRAAALLGAIRGLDPHYPRPIDCTGKILYERVETALRAALSPEDFDKAFHYGRAYCVDQAVALANEEINE